MKRKLNPKGLLLGATTILCLSLIGWGIVPLCGSDIPSKEKPKPLQAVENPPVTVEEARGRARLLHETIHGTLQVIHSQYYREDEGLPIPSRTLGTVFDTLAERWNVKIDWLAVNARAMDIDHKPRDEFEQAAAAALSKGEQEYERVENQLYRHVGLITLSSECLKCHLPQRKSNKDRAAGLVISMPIKRK